MSLGGWGIYKTEEVIATSRINGILTTEVYKTPAIEFDVFLSMDIKEDARITNYPVEEGGFTSAAKVISPIQITIVGAITELGEPASKNAPDVMHIYNTIETLESYRASTELVNIFTPQKVFLDMNLISLSWKHTAEGGVNLLEVTLGFQEVRTVKPQYTTIKVKNPKYETSSEGGNTPTEEQDPKSVLKKGANYLGDNISKALEMLAYL
jgi:hypothetical protein